MVARDGQLVRGLTNSSFVATAKKKGVTIAAADYDRGGRRIVIVVDRGSRMNEAGRVLTTAVLTKILSNARPEDSFGLITAGLNPLRISFGSSPANVLEKFNSNTEGSAGKIGVLDAIAESAGWFRTPQRGDALLIFAGDDDFRDSSAKFGKTLDLLRQQGIRAFAMLFGYVRLGTYYTFWNGPLSGPTPGSPLSTNLSRDAEELSTLAYGTGGYLTVENTHDQLHQYRLDPNRTKGIQEIGWQLYGGIAETYVLKMSALVDINSFQLGLAPDVAAKIPRVVVVQSNNPAACRHDSGDTNTTRP